MKENYINILKKLNKKAIKNGDIPVSTIIVKQNKIVSKAYNKKYKKNIPFYHAEIIAIKKACKKLRTPNLSDCILVTTLEPCQMCKNIIAESKLKKVYYILKNNKKVNVKVEYINLEDKNNYFKEELQNFFITKR